MKDTSIVPVKVVNVKSAITWCNNMFGPPYKTGSGGPGVWRLNYNQLDLHQRYGYYEEISTVDFIFYDDESLVLFKLKFS